MSVPGLEPAASDLRFETLFEHAPFSVQLLARDGRTLRVNRAWLALWQAADDDGLKAYVLRDYNVLTDPQLEAKGVTAGLRRAFAGESVTLPTIHYVPSEIGKVGHSRWVRGHAQPVRNAEGEVVEVLLMHEDVTDRLHAEQALQLGESRLKQLANTIPQLVWMADPEGSIHWYNDRWYDYTGTRPEQMAGWGWQSVHDPAWLPDVLTRWRHSLAVGEPFRMTFPLRGSDGVFRPFFTLVAPLKDAAGKVVQWFGTNTDVSALHEAERGLREAEERLRLATHAGRIGIWDWDFERDLVSWSDEVYLLHELQPGSFGGRAADFTALVHPDDRERLWHAIETAIRERSSYAAEFRALMPDGRVKWLSTWARMRQRTSEKHDRMIGAVISIDAYKQAEAALRESDRRKDEFLAMLAHELRNPLAPISAAAQVVQRHAGDGSVLRASQIISRQVRHIAELVDDLLDVSRVTRGRIELERQTVDLKAIVSTAMEQARPAIDARGHALTTRLGAEAALVDGDATRLVQAIVNVLNNAARYTPEGGSITLSLQRRANQVDIVVTDDGNGIDADLLPHVFDLFTQGSRNPSRAEGGLGIGLALVRSIVRLHGGDVRAESPGAGRGSTFTLTLPLCDAAVATPSGATADGTLDETAASPAPPACTRALDVMIVDDNVDAARSLEMLLTADGHRVVLRHDARSALQAVQAAASASASASPPSSSSSSAIERPAWPARSASPDDAASLASAAGAAGAADPVNVADPAAPADALVEGRAAGDPRDAAGASDAARGFTGVPEVFILDIGLPDLDGYELARRLRQCAAGSVFIALTGYGQAQDRAQSKAAGFDHHFLKPVDTRVLRAAMLAGTR